VPDLSIQLIPWSYLLRENGSLGDESIFNVINPPILTASLQMVIDLKIKLSKFETGRKRPAGRHLQPVKVRYRLQHNL
jgi:hypothetical protein